jgi:hypothetical protein
MVMSELSLAVFAVMAEMATGAASVFFSRNVSSDTFLSEADVEAVLPHADKFAIKRKSNNAIFKNFFIWASLL